MSLKTLLFVSQSLLQPEDEAAAVVALVESCRERNLARGITGAVVVARGCFAEVLEGPEESVQALMESIARDPRHRELRIVQARDTEVRHFAPWPMALAYAGGSFYIARHITPLLADPNRTEQARLASQLFYLIKELAYAERR